MGHRSIGKRRSAAHGPPTRRVVLGGLLSLAGCGLIDGSDPDADILLFTGTGTSPGDVAAIRRLLRREHLRFATANSPALGAMTPEQLSRHRLLIVPGGNFELIGNALPPAAAANIRTSVGTGLHYLGLCAGAFFAGDSPYRGLNLTGGVRFGFHALEARGIRRAAVPIATPGGTVIEHYWEDGPELSGWGEAIARYPDGKPAVVQGRVGRGWVVLTGTHPEADESWREGLTFAAPARAANDFAVLLIRAALEGRRLAHF